MTLRSLLCRPFLLSLLATALAAQSPVTIGIGTWNLEFLGAEGNFRNNLPPRDDADLHKIGEQVRALGVQVLAVQEICGEAPLAKVAQGAGPSWRYVLGTTGGWNDGKTSQQIGFLYDSAVLDLLGAEELLELPREQDGVPIFHRVPVTAWFRVKATGFDFRAVTVHLKAGQKKQDEQKRRLEASALHAWLQRLRTTATEDQDYVLLGDFSSTYGSVIEQILKGDEVVRYVEQMEPQPTIQHLAKPVDHIAAGPGFVELRRGSYSVHTEPAGVDRAAWRAAYSDHYPVTVIVDTAGDADPAAEFTRGATGQALPATLRPAPVVAAVAQTLAPAASMASAWPPTVGAPIQVRIVDGTHYSGRLREPLPKSTSGWLVVEAEGSVRAVPFLQVSWISLP